MQPSDRDLRERARQVIPNGMYGHMSTALMPEGIPQFYSRAEGTRLWDAEGNSYIDCLAGYGPNLLGYGDRHVREAALLQMDRIDTGSGPASIMVDLAERLVDTIDYADWAMFCKNGSDATSVALMVARSFTARRKILIARNSYHGAHNWSTPKLEGVLQSDREHILYFDFNDPDSLDIALEAAAGDLAGIIVTPYRHEVFEDQKDFAPQFARRLRGICDEAGAMLILDEVRTGFRLAAGSSWQALGISPDLSCWGKALANGQPISAVVGIDALRKAAGSIYVTGSFWFSAVPMAAAIATLEQVQEGSYLRRMQAAGSSFRQGLTERAAQAGFCLRQTGAETMPLVMFDDDDDLKLGYGFTAAMGRRGVLISPYHNMFMNAAMTPDDIGAVLDAAEQSFAEIRRLSNTLPDVPKAALDRSILARIKAA